MKKSSTVKKTTVLYFFLIAIISAQISCNSSKNASTFDKKRSDLISEETLSLRVMSYNILVDYKGQSWKNRGLSIASILETSNADIIGVQEASELQIATLQEHLQKYYCFVGDRSDGHRNDQKWYEYVPIFYNKDRFNLLEKSSFWISEDPTKPGGTIKGSTWHGRSLSWLKLQDKKTQKIIFIFNAHIHPQKATVSVNLIQRKIQLIAEGNPTILMGDFNLIPGSEAYKLITGNSENKTITFQDSYAISKKRLGPEKTHERGERIDYVYLQGKFHVSVYQVLTEKTKSGGGPSDHNPVLVELDLKF